MDTGNGVFEQVVAKNQEALEENKKVLEEKHPLHGGWFQVGEVLEIRGSRFKIQAVKPNQLRLKLLRRKAV